MEQALAKYDVNYCRLFYGKNSGLVYKIAYEMCGGYFTRTVQINTSLVYSVWLFSFLFLKRLVTHISFENYFKLVDVAVTNFENVLINTTIDFS